VGNNNLHILLLGSFTVDVNELFKNKFNPPEYCPTRESTYPFEAASLPNWGSGIWGGVLNRTCPLMSNLEYVFKLFVFIVPVTDKLFVILIFCIIEDDALIVCADIVPVTDKLFVTYPF
jgi:hypothetical protein